MNPANPPTSFNAIPGQDDLGAVERDLSFHPSSTTGSACKVLSAAQINYNQQHG